MQRNLLRKIIDFEYLNYCLFWQNSPDKLKQEIIETYGTDFIPTKSKQSIIKPFFSIIITNNLNLLPQQVFSVKDKKIRDSTKNRVKSLINP